MACTHTETCEECHEALRKEKALASLRSGLVAELRELLGVDHLKGNRQLEAAVAEVKRLQAVEKRHLELPSDGGEQHYNTQEYARRLSGL